MPAKLAHRILCKEAMEGAIGATHIGLFGKWLRLTFRMQKLLARLDGSANLMEPVPPRSRYMHHRTYQRLLVRYLTLSCVGAL